MTVALQDFKSLLDICPVIKMDRTPLSDDEFFKKYEAYEKESVEDFLRRYSSTEKELRDTIDYLIRHREMMRTLRFVFG